MGKQSSLAASMRDALAEVLTRLEGHPRWEFVIENPHHAAEVILSSDWMRDLLDRERAKAWQQGAVEGLRTPSDLGYMLRNPYRSVNTHSEAAP